MADLTCPPQAVDPEVLQAWRAQGLHGEQNLDQAFAASAQAWPDAPLLLDHGDSETRCTLAQLHQGGLRLAASLAAMGLRSGDVLAVQLPVSLEGVLLQRAAAALGAIFLPIVPIYGPAELSHILNDARARMLVLPEQTRLGAVDALLTALVRPDTLREVVVIGASAPASAMRWADLPQGAEGTLEASDRHADDVALLIYTSGTTAAPKGVQHSANSLLAETRAQAMRFPGPPTAQLSPWTTGHIAGLVTLMDHALRGRPTVMMDSWDAARAARLIEQHYIVASSGTPFHLAGLLDAADAAGLRLDSLRDYLTGAASVPSSLVQRCAARGLATYRAYGLSEHPTVTIGSADDALAQRLHTEGQLTPGNEIRLVDDLGRDVPPGSEGEIATRGPERFMGYTDPALNEHSFLPGGWFLTGDVGCMDTGGFLRITDRKKDIVNRGGEKIASREVENALLALPEVADAAVLGVPDELLGERVCAYLVLKPGHHLTLDTVAAHFTELGLARQKSPERLITVDSLPRTPSGKVNKPALREALKQQISSCK